MVVDTSAWVAVLLEEQGHEQFLDSILDASHIRLSAATAVELGIIAIMRAGSDAEIKVDLLLARTGADVIPVTEAQAQLARSTFRTFGKGRHPAGLNFGDCFSYALAKSLNEPLLFKGNDFSRTDIISAL